MKVALDTNVLVSGLLAPKGTQGRVLGAWIEARYELVLAFEQLEEIGRVLTYPKIRGRLGCDDAEVGRLLEQLYLICVRSHRGARCQGRGRAGSG